MDLKDMQERVDEIRPDDHEASGSVKILMTKIGQMAEGINKIEQAPDDAVPDENKAAAHRDMLAGVLLACMEYATEHDVDVEQAVEERLEQMREMVQIKEAMDSGDPERLADAVNEASGTDDEDDEDDTPSKTFY